VEGDVGEPVAKSGTVDSFELFARDDGRVIIDHFEPLSVISKIETRATHDVQEERR
jgi:hypothetical protein